MAKFGNTTAMNGLSIKTHTVCHQNYWPLLHKALQLHCMQIVNCASVV